MANSITESSYAQDDTLVDAEALSKSPVECLKLPNGDRQPRKAIDSSSGEGTTSKAGIDKAKQLRLPREPMVTIIIQYFELPTLKGPSKVPALVQALRCVPDLYYEALKHYYRRGHFSITWANENSIKRLSPTIFKKIKQLSIDANLLDTSNIPTDLLALMDLDILNVTLKQERFSRTLATHKFLELARYWLKKCASVRELSQTLYFLYPITLDVQDIRGMEAEASAGLGKPARFLGQQIVSDFTRRAGCSWRNKDGSPLVWKLAEVSSEDT